MINVNEKIKTIEWENLKRFNNIKSERISYITKSKKSLWVLKDFIVSVDGVKFNVKNSPFNNLPKRCSNPVLYNRLLDQNIEIDNFFESIVKNYHK